MGRSIVVSLPALMQIKVVSPKLGATNLACSPLQVARITPCEGGIDLNHRDAGPTSFDRLRLVSVFAVEEAGTSPYQLLVFLRGQRRPFLVAANTVQLAQFPLERHDTLLPQFRSFVRYLWEQNSGLAVDRKTYEFLNGKMPERLLQDVLILATGLGDVLQKADEVDGVSA